MLLGAEADVEGRSQDDKSVQRYQGSPDSTYPVKTDVPYAASLRARLGYIFNGGNILAFMTGGYTGADIKTSFGDTSAPATETHSSWENGWTAGAGLEYLFSDKISVKLEYRYSDYGARTVSTSAVYSGNYSEKQEYHDHIVWLGIAYHF